LRRKKKEKEEEKVEPTLLEKICSDNKKAYKALRNTMLLFPSKIEVSLKEAVEKAEDFEKEDDDVRAGVWYHVAGGLALWKGDVKKVKKYFEKCAELVPNRDYSILENTERAVEKAQEYYKKYSQEN
jgi:E3 ubiquitin-protein ligase DOA10